MGHSALGFRVATRWHRGVVQPWVAAVQGLPWAGGGPHMLIAQAGIQDQRRSLRLLRARRRVRLGAALDSRRTRTMSAASFRTWSRLWRFSSPWWSSVLPRDGGPRSQEGVVLSNKEQMAEK